MTFADSNTMPAMKTLRKHMKRNRLTQVKMARELGVSQATVCQWLSGQKNPTLHNLEKLADFTGLTADALLDRKVQALPKFAPTTPTVDAARSPLESGAGRSSTGEHP